MKSNLCWHLIHRYFYRNTLDNIPHNDTNLANAEENSGYYEGDILTKMDTRNGLADPLARWPSKVMPYVIGPGYSKQSSIKAFIY